MGRRNLDNRNSKNIYINMITIRSPSTHKYFASFHSVLTSIILHLQTIYRLQCLHKCTIHLYSKFHTSTFRVVHRATKLKSHWCIYTTTVFLLYFRKNIYGRLHKFQYSLQHVISGVNVALTSHVKSLAMFPLLISEYKMCTVGMNTDVEKFLLKIL
jgi:hypothetical protein